MNIFGEDIPPSQPADGSLVTFGGSTFSVTPLNYMDLADKYWTVQRNKFPNTITESDRDVYRDTFAQIANRAPKNYTLDANGAAVPNDQGFGTYLGRTLTGGFAKTVDKLNKDVIPSLPDSREL